MRSFLLFVIVFALLPVVFVHPVLGAYLWAWVSLMNPHKLAFGAASEFSFALVVAIVTLLALLLTRKRYAYPINSITIVWLLMVAWMSFTTLFALNSSDLVMDRWVAVLKIQLMMAVTIVLIRSRPHLEVLIWVVTLSIGYYGIKGGIWTVLTGGGERVWGPEGSQVADNNALGAALVMLMPFLYYLWQVSTQAAVRWFLGFSMVAICFAILGSQSRGALVAVLAMAITLGLKSRHPFSTTSAFSVLLVAAVWFMPESWSDRMNTIREYEAAGGSAMSRIYSWITMWNLAIDRPLVGGGFRSDAALVYQLYAPVGPQYDIFAGQWWVAHSIYFQMLGEHGFVGLGLFLTLGILTWRRAGQLAKLTRDDPNFGRWVPSLMPMVQVSLVGYASGGAFLSLAYFDWPYYIVSYVVIVDAMVGAHRPAVATVKEQRALQARRQPLDQV